MTLYCTKMHPISSIQNILHGDDDGTPIGTLKGFLILAKKSKRLVLEKLWNET